MKKNLIYLSLVLLFFANTANAQQSNTSFGIQAGTNYSKYTPRFPVPNLEDIRFTGKIGFYLGGFVNIEISEKFRIQPSLIFASQGSKFKNENLRISNNNSNTTFANYESNIIESTIVVPIVVQNYLGKSFYIEAGPQMGYIFSLKDRIIVNTVPGSNNVGSFGGLSETNYDKFDLGLVVGVGYRISENFGLNSRYFFGVLDRNNNLKSSVLNIGIEYNF